MSTFIFYKILKTLNTISLKKKSLMIDATLSVQRWTREIYEFRPNSGSIISVTINATSTLFHSTLILHF